MLLLTAAAVMAASLLLLCPAAARAQGGVPLWTNRYIGPANLEHSPRAIAVDSSGNVSVTGISFVSGLGDDSYDYATIKYSSTGDLLWTNRYNGHTSGGDDAQAIAVDSSGNVFVTGTSFVTIKYSSSVPPPRLDFQLLNNQLVMNWTNAGFNLQSAPVVPGTFTNITGATSPYTNPITGPQIFSGSKRIDEAALPDRDCVRRTSRSAVASHGGTGIAHGLQSISRPATYQKLRYAGRLSFALERLTVAATRPS